MISNIPNLVYLAPTSKEEYLKMLDWSIEQTEHPVVIRVPSTNLISTGIEDDTDYSNLNKFSLTQKGEKIALIGLGNFYWLAMLRH
jgi:1-deoxy-D-xylulose-5-phosphate synthase